MNFRLAGIRRRIASVRVRDRHDDARQQDVGRLQRKGHRVCRCVIAARKTVPLPGDHSEQLLCIL